MTGKQSRYTSPYRTGRRAVVVGRDLFLLRTLSIVFLLGGAVSQAQDLPSTDDVVAKVRANVFRSFNSLPDFVCIEKITSRSSEKGKVKEQRIIESVFTSVRVETKPNNYTMRESREIKAIDGKTAPKNAKTPKSPLWVDGIATTAPMLVVTPEAYTYKAIGLERSGNNSALRVEFATKPGQQRVTGNLFRNSTGSVLIDMESMQPLYINNHSLEIDALLSEEIGRVEIDQASYWLPRLFKIEMLRKNRTLTYIAEYSDCRKFEVSTQIKAAQ